MKPWKVWLSGLTLFGAGVLLGVLLPFVFGRFVGPGMLSGGGFGGAVHGPEGAPPTPDRFIMGHMTRTLNLDPGQQEKIRPLVRAMVEEIHSINKQVFSETDRVADAYGKRIKELLTAEQAERFDKMVEHIRSRRARMLPPPGPPPPGMPPGFAPPPPESQ